MTPRTPNLAAIREWAEEARDGGYDHVSVLPPEDVLALLDLLEARALPDPTVTVPHYGEQTLVADEDRTAQVAAIAAALHASQRWCDGAESLSFRIDTTEDDARVAVDVHGDDAAALYDAGLRSGAHILPDDTVCACLDETGERKVVLYEQCQRCGAFMLHEEPDGKCIVESCDGTCHDGPYGLCACQVIKVK